MNRATLEQHLRDAWNAGHPDDPHAIELPSTWDVDGDLETELRIRLPDVVADANMQKDLSAFEPFTLAVAVWLKARRVRLSWGSPKATGHLRRLEYRAAKWGALFPWFTAPVVESASDLVLNLAREVREGADSNAAVVLEQASENELELQFARDGGRALKAALGLDHLARQLPVGTFVGVVSQATAHFPGRKASVDLWGVQGDLLHLLELKKAKNTKAGALSELFFYSMLLRDVQSGVIRFGGEDEASRRILATRRIKADILAPSFHPLLDASLFAALNAAFGPEPRTMQFGLLRFDSQFEVTRVL
jgi:hypothetical protein